MINNYKAVLDQIPEVITLEGRFSTCEVWINGKKLKIKPSLRIQDHSNEFNWGYGGSGPSQLALAILLKYWDRCKAAMYYQDFKFDFICGLPATDFNKQVPLRQIMQEVLLKRSVQNQGKF